MMFAHSVTRQGRARSTILAAAIIIALACTCGAPSQGGFPTVAPLPLQPTALPTYTPNPTYTPSLPTARSAPLPLQPPAQQPAQQPAQPPAQQPQAPQAAAPTFPVVIATLYLAVPIIASTDLAVTDIYPDSWPHGTFYVRITNHGHGTLSNEPNNHLSCVSVGHTNTGATTRENNSSQMLTLSLTPGQTGIYGSGLAPVNAETTAYDVTCTIEGSLTDPTPGNNSYFESFSPP